MKGVEGVSQIVMLKKLLCFSVIPPVHMLHFVSFAASSLCHFVSHTTVACATHIVSCVVSPSVIQNYFTPTLVNDP